MNTEISSGNRSRFIEHRRGGKAGWRDGERSPWRFFGGGGRFLTVELGGIKNEVK